MTVTDRPWALGDVRVSVFTVNPVDHSQDVPVQTAEVHVLATLIDYNSDDPWFGFVGFTLLFLGRGPLQQVIARQPGAKNASEWALPNALGAEISRVLHFFPKLHSENSPETGPVSSNRFKPKN